MRRVFTPRERIAKARIQLLIRFPFYGCLAMKMRPVELTEEEAQKNVVPALAVDTYGNLIYNPRWVKEQEDQVLLTGVAHEVLHLALKHLERKGSRIHTLWNIATDAAINDILSRTFSVPDDWVQIDEMRDRSAEEIYDYLIKDASVQKKNGYGLQWDVHMFKEDGHGFSTEGQEPFDSDRAVKEAWNFAKQQGRLPAGIERWFKSLLEPTINWKDYLRRMFINVIPSDFSYTSPHKKSYAAGFYIPRVKKEQVQVIVAVDTSGSIGDEEYIEFMTEIFGLCRQFESVDGKIILCDADIQGVYDFTERFDPLSIPRKGYGGTSAIPVYKWIEENMNQSEVRLLVYFTDGYIDVPDTNPQFDTLWVLSSNSSDDAVSRVPRSTVLRMREDE